ncbi:MAG: acetylxylan esterase [Solirubrobacterales bacterium]
MRKLAVLVVASAALMFAPAANATITSVLDGDLACATVTVEGNVAGSLNQRWCGTKPDSITSTLSAALPTVRSTVKTFDGVPLDVNVAFPPNSGISADGPYPVVGMYHGYGGSKVSFSGMQRWLQKGYAVFSLTNRGSGESCRSQASITADQIGCANGYVHLMDPRFEIRDAQIFLGKLVDEGLIEPDRIAATGGSYGGSESMHFAILKDRMMMLDGSFVAWESPEGIPMSTAVATPNIPWTDLIQSLAPNGDTLDYLEDGSFTGVGGVMKESYVNGLYISARAPLLGTDSRADLQGWKGLLDAGEPYTGAASEGMFEEITSYHSPYYMDDSQSPAPLLMSSGFTDDLFPVDEVIRFYNRTRANYPNTPMSIFAGSFGHARGQTQANVISALLSLEEEWICHYLTGDCPPPPSEVTAFTQTCPNGSNGGGPYTAEDWASVAPGEIVVQDGSTKTISALIGGVIRGGDPVVAAAFNPVTSPNPCIMASDAIEPGTVVYDTAPAPAGGYTVLGSATVVARISVSNGPQSQIMARLVDLDNAGNKTLIARGSWRPKASGFQVFQLHPGAWKVEEGHSVRLELLPRDAVNTPPSILTNYARPSNNQQNVTVEKLELRIPVVETPGSLGGLITAPAEKVLPSRVGAALAPGYEAIGSQTLSQYAARYAVNPRLSGAATVKLRTVTARLACAAAAISCRGVSVSLVAKGKTIARGVVGAIEAGRSRVIPMTLAAAGVKLFKDRLVVTRRNGKRRVVTVPGLGSITASVLLNRTRAGSVLVKRIGAVR